MKKRDSSLTTLNIVISIYFYLFFKGDCQQEQSEAALLISLRNLNTKTDLKNAFKKSILTVENFVIPGITLNVLAVCRPI